MCGEGKEMSRNVKQTNENKNDKTSTTTTKSQNKMRDS